jgi:glycerol-3-phosphate acyltransferase PlsX
MTLIALDAMGGDRVPTETVAGAVTARAEGIEVVLVGDRVWLEAELAILGAAVPIVHAPETIEMGEDPARGLRDKPKSSISRAAQMVRDGEAGALVSAGSTGAAMAAAAIIIGRARGVMRPAIGSVIPTAGTPIMLVDAGANPEVKAEHLVQFALMGEVAAQVFFGMTRPRVGLVNNGEEPGKGRDLEKKVHKLLAASTVNFVGNVEGRDLANDRADVFVTDGFVGNILLKTTEGVASMVMTMAMEVLAGLDLATIASVLTRLEPVRNLLDPEYTGGAHLLGANGVVVIAHGSSGRLAIANSLRMARDGIERDLVGKMTTRLAGG